LRKSSQVLALELGICFSTDWFGIFEGYVLLMSLTSLRFVFLGWLGWVYLNTGQVDNLEECPLHAG